MGGFKKGGGLSKKGGYLPPLSPFSENTAQGLCVAITCGNISGHLFLSKLEESKKAQEKYVLVGEKWYTPSDVEALAGKKARKWFLLGRPLSEFHLSPLDFQGLL